jgi:hypothetical protein
MTLIIEQTITPYSPLDTADWNWLLGDKRNLNITLNHRIQDFEAKAKAYRVNSIAAQLLGAGGAVTSLILSANPVTMPVALLGLALGGGSALFSIWRDWDYTGNPTILEFAGSMGRFDDPESAINQHANFLERHEAIEYTFLRQNKDPLVNFLASYDDLTDRVLHYQNKVDDFRSGRLYWPKLSFEDLEAKFTKIIQDCTYTTTEPPKVDPNYALEVIGQLPPTSIQQAPTVLQEDLVYTPNTDPIVVVDSLPVYEEFATTLQQHDLLPELRDLAKEIANYVGHVGLVAKTQSGKTTLLIGTVLEAVAAGHQVILVDGKGDSRLRALGQIQNVQYLHCNTSDKVSSLYALVDRLIKVLVERQDN